MKDSSSERDDADALHTRGVIALGRGDVAAALDLIEEATQRDPGNAIFMSNLAAAYHCARVLERARECAERALEIDPGCADAYTNHGHALAALGHPALAEASYRKALALSPTPLARLNAGVMRLLHGDYEAGLPLYEARLELPRVGGDAGEMLEKLRRVPRWRGEPLHGRRILVWTEQGLGDTVMLLRYLSLVRGRGAKHIAVCCEAALVRLVESLGIADEVFSDVDASTWPQRFDVHAPTMSLPLAFATTLETIPRPARYLVVPDTLGRKWEEKTSALGRPRIGIAWAGGKATAADPYRSIALQDFAPVLAKRNASFVSLQKGPRAADLGAIRRPISDWMDECGDLLETAALVDTLDLVISVDTVIAHLAAALGKPTWLLNRRTSEWRWLLERSDSPWYPTLRVFRQRDSAWSGVMKEVAAALEKEIAPPRGLLGRLGGLFGAKSGV